MSLTAASTSADASTLGLPAGTLMHPAYQTWAPIWRKLAHVYEGTGGFLDGTYLVAHPREWKDYDKDLPSIPTKKLLARRALARYENVAATILDQKRDAIFREPIVRTVGEADKAVPHPFETWCENVDGLGTCLTDWMAGAFTGAALFGHILHLMDRPEGPEPVTKADEQAPYLRLYTPLDVPDWLTDARGGLSAVRLLEAIPRTSLEVRLTATDVQERVVDLERWRVARARGQGVEPSLTGAHRFGRLPVVLHYAKRRALSPHIGKPVLNDPQLYIDLYNLTSEIRELLRNQTFGWLNVKLGTGEGRVTIEEAIQMMGQTAGTDNVLFTPGSANFIQPSTANVEVYQKERAELLRTIYRLAAIPWEADSRDAEAAGSLKLKREDMNQVLAAYADECERAEYAIAELWFRAQHGQGWQAAMAAASVVIRYPDHFDVTPFAEILDQAQAAIAIEMGPTFMKELRRRLVNRFIPDVSPSVLTAIEKELETMATREAETGGPTAEKVKAMLLRYGATSEAVAA